MHTKNNKVNRFIFNNTCNEANSSNVIKNGTKILGKKKVILFFKEYSRSNSNFEVIQICSS